MRRSTPFSEIEPRRIEWVWMEHIPAAMITCLAGAPGRGKSLLSFRIAADISQSGGDVMISNTEDRLHEVAQPRMAAAGADLARVHALRPQLPPLPEGYDQLAEEVHRHNARAVVLDPWASHCSVAPGNPALVRARVLDPLERLCEETGVAVLIVTHQVKHASPNANPLLTVGGPAAGLVGHGRAIYLVAPNPRDPDEFAMAPAKFNLGAWPPALALELDVAVDNPDAGFLSLRGETKVDARALVRAQYAEARGEAVATKSEHAQEWLAEYLWAAGGPCKPAEVADDAARLDPPITAKQLREAARRLGATDPKGGRGAVWNLPGDLREMLDAQRREADEQ